MKRKTLLLTLLLILQIVFSALPISAAGNEVYGWDAEESERLKTLLEELYGGKTVEEVFYYYLEDMPKGDYADITFGQPVPCYDGAMFGDYTVGNLWYPWNEGPYSEGYGSAFYMHLLKGEYEKAISCEELHQVWCVPVYAVNPATQERELYCIATIWEDPKEIELNEWDENRLPDITLVEKMFDFEAMYTYIQKAGIVNIDYYAYYMYHDYPTVLVQSDGKLYIIPLGENYHLHTGYEIGKAYSLENYLVKAHIKRETVHWEYESAGGAGIVGELPNYSTLVYADGKLVNDFVTYPIFYTYPVVPLRAVMESVGAEVDWDAESRTAIVKYNDAEYRFELGETNFNNEGVFAWFSISAGTPKQYVTGGNVMWENGNQQQLENPVYILNDRTMVPLSFIQGILGDMAVYDEEPNVLVIRTK